MKHPTIKHLGISPAIVDGIRGWRVIWRPLLETPIACTQPDGSAGLKRKDDCVKTAWFPIIGTITPGQAFADAARLAAEVYDGPVPKGMPQVHWVNMAAARGVKIRRNYSKPALNGMREKAGELLDQGLSPRQVAKQLNVDRSTVSRWRTRINKAPGST